MCERECGPPSVNFKQLCVSIGLCDTCIYYSCVYVPDYRTEMGEEIRCTNVTIGETVSVNVTVNMTSCDVPEEA